LLIENGKKINFSDLKFNIFCDNFLMSDRFNGIKFDIVIGNPPYSGKSENVDKLIKTFKFYDRRKNSASFFIEKTKTICNSKGIVSLIVPKSLSFVKGWEPTRKFLLKENRLISIIDVSESFEEVRLEQVIIIFKTEKDGSHYNFTTGEGWQKNIKILGTVSNIMALRFNIIPIYLDSLKISILNKLKNNSVLLGSISETFRGLPFQKKCSPTGTFPILKGANIGKYLIYGEIPRVQLNKNEYLNNKIQKLLQPKIVSQNIVAHIKTPHDRIIIMASYDKNGYLTLDTVMNTFITNNNFSYEYILAILNSKLAEWFYYWFVYNRAVRTMHFDKYYMGKLPIKVIEKSEQKPFIELVDKILAITRDEDYLENPQKQAKVKEYKNQIDQLIYKLYGLTEEEIKLVEEQK